MRIGIATYTRQQWDLLKQRALDRSNLDPTYRAWEKNRDKLVALLRGEGHEAVLIPMDVAEIEAWCNARHKKNTGDARSQLCADKLRKMDGQQVSAT